ncbi:unnamed protein product [Protopolystoma xenopodis]|uniref:Uncharacterized protein n=1 Tax=Protopolystoma xenopodis TaxID=117903 RepID=A0A3S5AZG8_9PLAT|nr:unnamed protein product [Protopolystoma xenopodis]
MQRLIELAKVSGSDDVRDMTGESSARSHRGRRTVSRGLLGTIQQTKVPSSRLLKRNERYPGIILLRDFSKASFSSYLKSALGLRPNEISQLEDKKPIYGPMRQIRNRRTRPDQPIERGESRTGLLGWQYPAWCKLPVILHVFVATETGRVRPHLFYKACRVPGKAPLQGCMERQLDTTSVIEIQFPPSLFASPDPVMT